MEGRVILTARKHMSVSVLQVTQVGFYICALDPFSCEFPCPRMFGGSCSLLSNLMAPAQEMR